LASNQYTKEVKGEALGARLEASFERRWREQATSEKRGRTEVGGLRERMKNMRGEEEGEIK
jgi:hypothetical protein